MPPTIRTPITQTAAFVVQAWISFAVATGGALLGIWMLPADGWKRGFLVLALLYTVTSAFTLAKVIRDQKEESRVLSRVDEARLEQLLAQHDPLRSS